MIQLKRKLKHTKEHKMTKDFKIDLHSHTYFSDGLYSPREVLLMAKAKGLTHIAITDHDTFYHIKDAHLHAKEIGIELINGIELSCYNFEKGKKVHIVGLFINDDAPHCEKLGNQVLEGRNRYHQKMIETLEEFGYYIDFQDAKHFSKSNTVFKMHLYQAMKDKYPEINFETYKKIFFKKDTRSVDLEMNYCSVKDGIQAILDDGGIPILAHPPLYDSFEDVEEYISYGLQGIEVSHPDMNAYDCTLAHKIALENNLYVSGGSDFHMFDAVHELGFSGINEEQYARLLLRK